MLFKDFLNVIVAVFATFGLYTAINLMYDVILAKIKMKKTDNVENQELSSQTLDREDKNKDIDSDHKNE